MAETQMLPVRRSPLAADGKLPGPLAGARLRISALALAARFSLRLREDAARRLGAISGLRLDGHYNSYVSDGARMVARLGPDEWLLSAPDAERERLAADISAALAGVHHALVDISHRQVAFAVAGPDSIAALNAGCPLDLDVRRFPTGSATRTLLGKAEVVLARTGDGPDFRLDCGRSFARYVWGFLGEAGREFL